MCERVLSARPKNFQKHAVEKQFCAEMLLLKKIIPNVAI